MGVLTTRAPRMLIELDPIGHVPLVRNSFPLASFSNLFYKTLKFIFVEMNRIEVRLSYVRHG